ncbi:Uu.00g106950.m01.CDS01 [Anthostomella pinea]|uniref:Uu.00g106950.m01.CDS01 n=1 Tax=Anthostomella pinea TaxID=933095 RepID=A0AAI8VE90_9PEZI|nr:Uu.00g106950.m01.CDS01 [Anthostomella pinea]
MAIAVLTGGLGFHVVEIVDRFGVMTGSEIFIKHLLAIQNLWALSLSLSKISILLLCSRVFVVNGYILVARITSVFICLWALATILSCFFICQPLAYNWDSFIPGGHCGDSVTSWLITGILNIITDLIVLILPMPYLWALELEMFKKLILMATFGVGLFTCVISTVRVITLVSVDFTDVTYTIPRAVLFSAMEPCLAITLACVPVLRPLLGRRYSPRGTAKAGSTTLRGTPRSGRIGVKSGPYSSIERLRPDLFHYDADVDAGDTRGDQAACQLNTITVSKAWQVQHRSSGVQERT